MIYKYVFVSLLKKQLQVFLYKLEGNFLWKNVNDNDKVLKLETLLKITFNSLLIDAEKYYIEYYFTFDYDEYIALDELQSDFYAPGTFFTDEFEAQYLLTEHYNYILLIILLI